MAEVDGRKVAVGNHMLMARHGIDVGPLAHARDRLAAGGRTTVLVGVDGHAAAVIALADTPRPTASGRPTARPR